MEKLRMKFSALNVDFEGPSIDFLGTRKPAHEKIKERYPCKSRYFTSDELFSRINIDDFERL